MGQQAPAVGTGMGKGRTRGGCPHLSLGPGWRRSPQQLPLSVGGSTPAGKRSVPTIPMARLRREARRAKLPRPHGGEGPRPGVAAEWAGGPGITRIPAARVP